jgi:hypothetical protein
MDRWRRSVSAVPLVSAAAVVEVPGLKPLAKRVSFGFGGFALAVGAAVAAATVAAAAVAAGCAVAAGAAVTAGVVAAAGVAVVVWPVAASVAAAVVAGASAWLDAVVSE